MGLLALGRGSAPVGLDIGNKTFRIAQLKPSAHKPILINYASKDTPFGLVDEGEIADVDGVAKVLSDFWRERKISEKKVVVGIANQKVIVRIIEMPYMTEAELKSAIQFQVSDYIPIPIEEAIIDFQIISERENDLQGKVMDVLV
ncbi:MAG: pilus assembly protein PilM, partial [Actinomycetota bacterium]|nr:pilus assembly protein PilM [Actinomycetota bacterium]